MKKFLYDLEQKHPFIISIIVSIGIIMWFRGLIGVIDILIVKENSLVYYLLLMIISMIILYVTNVGTDVIFDIEQRRKINTLLNKDEKLIEEDKHFLSDKVDNHHLHTSSTLYPTVHSL